MTMDFSESGSGAACGEAAASALAVPQCTYAIAKAGTAVACLETKNIRSCLGLVGVNPSTGVVFCAHLDTIASVLGLPAMLREVESLSGGDLDGFEIHDIAGVPPWCSGVLLALGLLGFALGECYAGLVGLISSIALGHVRFGTWLILRACERLPVGRVKHRPLGFRDIFRRTASVRVLASGKVTVEKAASCCAAAFDPPHGSGGGRTYRLLKAAGSL